MNSSQNLMIYSCTPHWYLKPTGNVNTHTHSLIHVIGNVLFSHYSMYANVFLSTNDDVEHFKWYFELHTKRADGKPYIRVGVAQYWTFLPYPSKGLDLEEKGTEEGEGRIKEKIERKHFVPMKL